MLISFKNQADQTGPALIVGVSAAGELLTASLAPQLHECLLKAVAIQRDCGRFTGKLAQTVEIIAPAGSGCRRLIGVCVGDPDALGPPALQKFGGAAVARLAADGERHAIIMTPRRSGSSGDGDWASQIALGAQLRNYLYTCERTRPAEANEPVLLERLDVVTDQPDEARQSYTALSALADAVHLARDLVNEPPNRLYPAAFVARTQSLSRLEIELQALEPEQLEALGMNALLAVGNGSTHRPRLLVLRWNGAEDPSERPLALVGKGITFDSGGLLVKTLEWMKTMKGDMAGGAAVVGAVMLAAKRQLPLNLVGVVPLAENSVSGSAYRPSDVIRSACGASIEVTHTDAEGRLILLDGIWYARAQARAHTIVSIGTVTGSGIFGLGRHYAGLYSTNEPLAEALLAAGKTATEPLWRMPLSDSYDEDLLSDIADYRQQAPFMYGADGTYVARLLRHAAADVPWAQVEMAGLEFTEKDTLMSPKGATGFGVRLLSQFVTTASSRKSS